MREGKLLFFRFIVDLPYTYLFNSDILNVFLICLHDQTSSKDIGDTFYPENYFNTFQTPWKGILQIYSCVYSGGSK